MLSDSTTKMTSSDWLEHKLEDIVVDKTIGLVKGKREQDIGYKYSYIKMNNISNDNRFDIKGMTRVNATDIEIEKFYLMDKDLLFNTRNSFELVGKSCLYRSISNNPVLFNNNIMRIRFVKEVDPSFAAYAFCSRDVVGQLESIKQGTTNVSAIYYKSLRNIKIRFSYIDEQKRTVAILDEAFAGIDTAITNTEKNLANARELFESYLNSVFTQRDKGWVVTTIENLVEKQILDKPLDGNHGEIHPKKADFVETGIPFVMASDLVNGEVDQVHCNFITEEQGDSLRKGFARDGDVLLSHKGTIGRVAVLNTFHDYVMLTPQVTYYRILDKKAIHNRYLYYFFQNPKFQEVIQHLAGAGSTRAYIGITKQLQLPVFYSSPDVQLELAAKFDALKAETLRLEGIYEQKHNSLNELKQSLLQKAFSGELTAEAKPLNKTVTANGVVG